MASFSTNFPLSKIDEYYIDFVVSFVFLNTTHTIFTFLILFFSTSIKDTLNLNTQNTIYIGFVFLCIISYAAVKVYFKFFEDAVVFKAIMLILFGFQQVHVIYQTKGFCFCYNRLNLHLLSYSEKRLQSRLRIIEILLFTVLATTQIIPVYFFIISNQDSYELRKLVSMIAIFIALCIVAIAYAMPGANLTNKKFYVWGLLFPALSPISSFATLASQSLHGIEYFFFFSKLYSNEKSRLSSCKKVIMCLLFFLLCAFLFVYRGLVFKKYSGFSSTFYQIIIFFGLVREFLHHFLDSLLFKYNPNLGNRNFVQMFMKTRN